jgi:hypothetical protein
MPSQKTSGTQSTSSIPNEYTLATITTAGVYVLAVDTSAMVKGDEVEVKIKVKVLTGGTTRTYLVAALQNVQGSPVVLSLPIPVLWEGVFTLNQVAGTTRSFPWEIIQLDA